MTTQDSDYRTPLAFTIWYLRNTEANVEGVAKKTTGGLVNTEWARSPEMQAALEGVKFRHHHKFLAGVLSAATAQMQAERQAWYGHAEGLMATDEWAAAEESDRREFLLRVAQATDTGEMGGPRVLGAHRPSAVAITEVYGEDITHKTLGNATARIVKMGWLKVTQGQGYEKNKQARSTVYELPDHPYTSPTSGSGACVRQGRTAQVEPLLRKLRAAFAAAVKLIRYLKTTIARFSHMPADVYLAKTELQGLSIDEELDLMNLLEPPPVIRYSAAV